MIEVMIAMALMSALAMGTASILTSQSKMSSQVKTYIDTSVLVMELSHALNDPTSLLESAAATAGKAHSNFLNCVVSNPPPVPPPPLLPIPAPKGNCIPVTSASNNANNLILTDQNQKVLANGIGGQFYDNNLQPCVPTSPGGTPSCGIEAIASYTATCPPTSPNNCQPAATVTITYTVQVAPGVRLANSAIFPTFSGSMAESVPFQMTNSSAYVQGSGTANYIPVWTGSGTLGSTSSLYQLATTSPDTGLPINYYGVNTVSPNYGLDVAGGIHVLSGMPFNSTNWNLANRGYSFGPNGDTGFFENQGGISDSAGDLEFTINGNSKVQIAESGQIALGAVDNAMAPSATSTVQQQPTVMIYSDPTSGDQGTNLIYMLPNGGPFIPMNFVADFSVQRINNNGGQNPGVNLILDATQSASASGTGHSIALAVGTSFTTDTNGTGPGTNAGNVFAIQDLGTIASTGVVATTPANNLMTLDSNGNMAVEGNLTVYKTIYNNGALTTISDQRLKTNIQPLTNSLDKIEQLQGVTWDWKDPVKYTGTRMGFIAQELEQIYPDSVVTRPDGYKAINYASLVAPLTEAVKELDAKNTALANENAQLRQRLDRLEAMVQQLAGARQQAPVGN